METEFIIKSIVVLAVVLAVLVFLLFLDSDKEPKIKKDSLVDQEPVYNKPLIKAEETIQVEDVAPKTDLKSLVKIIKNKRANADEIDGALDMIIKYHGRVHKKLGLRSHPDFDIYMEILFTICRHPNANKDLIIKFDRELERLNPEYKQDINEAITKGLNSRRV